MAIIEKIFPELRESEDERIRKNCIHFLELQKAHHADTSEIDDCIAYLERQREQKSAEWSEEDKNTLEDAITAVDLLGNDESFNKGNPNLAKAFRVAKDRLKSFPERLNLPPKQEWGEEDIDKMVNARARKSGTAKSEIEFYRQGIKDTLKSLRPQPHWKPNEEQMNALYNTLHPDDPYYYELRTLYEQLAKL